MGEEISKNRIIKESDIDEIIERKLAQLTGEPLKQKLKEEHHHPKPHHVKQKEPTKLTFDFEENVDAIMNIFGDESTALAVIKALKDSPSEIQVIAKLIIDLYVRLDVMTGE